MTVEKLWSRALDDAGIEPSHVQRIGFEGPVSGKRIAEHLPPGSTPGGVFELTPAERAVVAKHLDDHRVVHMTEGEEPGLLGVLRAQLARIVHETAAAPVVGAALLSARAGILRGVEARRIYSGGSP